MKEPPPIIRRQKEPVNNQSDTDSAKILLARQPIFQPDLSLYAYELLYRSTDEKSAAIGNNETDQRNASIQVVINSIMDIGVENITDNHIAFFNIPAEMVIQGLDLPLGGPRIGLDVLNAEVNLEDLRPALESLKVDNMIVALDDFRWTGAIGQVLDLVDIVKINIASIPHRELVNTLEKLWQFNVRVAAKMIETRQQFEFCRELGFSLFQGFFLSQPSLIKAARLPGSKINILRLISKLQDPDVSAQQIEEIVRHDVALHFRLLRTVNSAYYGLSIEIKSIPHAVAYLGLATVRRWAYMQLIADSDSTPGEMVRQALLRARMCELLTREMPGEVQDTAFTIGLFSLLDSMLELSMEEILSQLPFEEEIAVALIQRAGPYGRLLETVIQYEQGQWQGLSEGIYSPENLSDSYIAALQWAGEQYRILTGETG